MTSRLKEELYGAKLGTEIEYRPSTQYPQYPFSLERKPNFVYNSSWVHFTQ